MYQFRIHHSTITKVILQVFDAIYTVLQDDYLKCPTSQEDWPELADHITGGSFQNAYDTVDGKYITLFHPFHTGSKFYNYMGFFSTVLMALVDYDYKFMYVDVGCQGRISDDGVFRNSFFYEKMVNNCLNLPPLVPLSKSNIESWEPLENDDVIPFLFVADNAFPLTTGIMQLYPDKGLTNKKRFLDTVYHVIVALQKMHLA